MKDQLRYTLYTMSPLRYTQEEDSIRVRCILAKICYQAHLPVASGINELQQPEFTYPPENLANPYRVADKRFKQLGGLERRPSPITLATDSRTPSPLMAHYNASTQGFQGGQGGYVYNNQMQMRPEGYPNSQEAQRLSSRAQEAHSYYRGSQQNHSDFDDRQHRSHQENYPRQYASEHYGEDDYYHGSQQGFQPGSSAEAAGPRSDSSGQKKSRRHKSTKAPNDSVKMTSDEMWECCRCHNAWLTSHHEICQASECVGHIRCKRCRLFYHSVPYDH
ncbi:hypothetical protein TWF718_008389 [Orbilia javanica]|uniref:Uncharacterized protein n=1 Tax=Orbilia javanica TaxID=47235 RepID=A0AAN8MQ79_9PEZI